MYEVTATYCFLLNAITKKLKKICHGNAEKCLTVISYA